MMIRALVCLSLLLLTAAGAPRGSAVAQDPAPGFVALDVFVDAGDRALAAWQCELKFAASKLVGVEGGAVPAFADAPRYDPAALQGGRVVLAALAQGQQFPTGRMRVARLHLEAPGGELGDYTLGGAVAASAHGERIAVDLEVRRHGDKR